jgi:hypothetical protein
LVLLRDGGLWRLLLSITIYVENQVPTQKTLGLFNWYQQRALVLVYTRLQDISKLLTDKVRFSNYRSQQQLSRTSILSDFEVLLA